MKNISMAALVAVTLTLPACTLAVDKQLHIVGGAALQPAQQALVPEKLRDTRLERCAAAIAIGAAKEIVHDGAMGRGTPEVADFAATVAGCLVLDFILEDVAKPAYEKWRENRMN